jgi:hypothetical protein
MEHLLTAIVPARAHTAALAAVARRRSNEGRNSRNTTESLGAVEAFFVEVVCGCVVGRHVGCAHKARALHIGAGEKTFLPKTILVVLIAGYHFVCGA